MNISDTKENPYLYLYFGNSYSYEKSDLAMFIRETGGYKRELKTEEISNPVVYTVYEIDILEYYNKTNEIDYLLSSSKEELLIYRIMSNNQAYFVENYVFHKTYYLPLSQQSLAAKFFEDGFDNYKLLIFVGVKEFLNDDTIKVSFSEMDKYTKLYYYIYSRKSELINFYYNCKDDQTKNYLFMNYGELKNEETYYFRFQDLIGSDARIAEIQFGNYDFKKFNYNDLNKFNYFFPEISHIHIIELKCPGDNNKILANIKYHQKENEAEFATLNFYDVIYDFPFTFGEKKFTLKYIDIPKNEFSLEIFIPNEESNKTFKITFENDEYEVITNQIYLFNMTNRREFVNLTIESNENIQAFVSVSAVVEKFLYVNKNKKYLEVYYGPYITYDLNYVYQIEHEFNTNYYIDFEIENFDSMKKFCYHVANPAIPAIYSQNCFLLNNKGIKNISLYNIFKYTESQDYNSTEQKYDLVVYHDNPINLFKDVYFRTDLPTSKGINSFIEGHNYLYLDASLTKDEPSYFNLDLKNKTLENNFNLYILNDSLENNNELLFDIKCIKVYEPYLDYIKHYFNDEEQENVCYIINKEDLNTRVYHIIFTDNKKESHEKLIIQIIPKIDLNIKLITDYSKTISNQFNYDQIGTISDSFIHQIYEIKKEDISKINDNSIRIIYNKHSNGLKLYARNKYDFEHVKTGSIIVLKREEILEKYQNYDKFLLIIGQNDCENYKESNSIFQYLISDDIFYYSLSEFNGYYRILVENKKKINYQYIILDYGKQYLKGDIHFTNYDLLGYANEISYYSELNDSLFKETDVELKQYQVINDNIQHLIIIRFNNSVEFKSYFDYFSEIDYSSQMIKLDKSSIKNYIITKDQNYTFNYEESDIITIELLDDTENPIIYFENKIYNLNKDKTITLQKANNNYNLLYIYAPTSSNVPIRVITLINLKNIPKTDLQNLYKIEGKYIYDYNPKSIRRVTFHIKRANSALRILKGENSEDSGINICYNIAKMIILEENQNNCFILKDTYDFEYDSIFNYETYLTFYSEVGEDSFIIEKIDIINQEKDPKDEGDEGGSKTWIIILVVVLVILLIGLAILIFIRIKKRNVSSYDIETLEKIID